VGGSGQPNSDGSGELTAAQGSEQTNRSNYAAENLLPHEQRARELLLQRSQAEQKREVNIRGSGPQATRAGRPWPMSEADRLALARSAVEKKKAQEYDLQRKKEENSENRFTIRRPQSTPRHVMGDSERISRSYREPETEGETSRWSQLRRRRETPAQESQEPAKDKFTEDRAQREEQARLARYTPLGGRSKPSSWGRDTDSQNQIYNPPGIRRIRLGNDVSQQDDTPWMSRDQAQSWRNEAGGKEYTRTDSQPTFKPSRPDPYFPPAESDNTTGYESSRPQTQTQERNSENSDVQVQEPDRRRGRRGSRYETDEVEEQEEREERQTRRPSRFAAAKPAYEDVPRGKGRDKARRRQQFVEEGEEEDDFEREEARRRAEIKRRRKAEKAARKAATPTPILLPEYISLSNLAVALKVRFEVFVEKLQELGYEEFNHDYILNAEDAGLIAMEFNYEAIIDRSESEDLKARPPAEDPSSLPPRPPVVTIMGHVDHGKTTLLDWLRKSSVAASEHGGITQHIGAFSVPMPSGKTITFLDTPGHAAFLSMRQRGANVTDIVILVVAADDSVKPQTIEAIKHAKAAKVPIIVAINKIDKEEANVDRVKQDLARHGVDVEDYGGETQVVCVSGKTGRGMDELEESIVTLSEILDMRAEPDGQAEGWILEASIKSMGKVATVLVRRGTMRPGDYIVAGNTWARIRCLRNEAGVEIFEAGPGTPVEVDGWREQPLAGDEVLQAPDETKAKSVVDYRLEKAERDKMAEDMEAVNLNRKAEQEKREREKEEARIAAETEEADEDAALETQEKKPSGTKHIFFIVKGDVSGSVEAVIDSISALGNKEVQPHILRSGVGQISEFDIEHAATAKGLVVNFNCPIEPHISRLAEENKVGIIDQNIIYRLVDDVKAELSKHLPPLITQRVMGEAEIAQIFEITVKGRQQKNIAGCKVRNGAVSRSAKVRVLRNGQEIFNGMSFLNSLFPSPIFPPS
jgi:translation initiation factor IF-2